MKLVRIPRTCAVALVLTATALWASPAGEEEPAAAMEKEMVMDPSTGEMVMDPSTGEMVTAPRYGGTLTFAQTGPSASADIVVPGGWAEALVDPVLEKLSIADWATPRDEFDFVFLFPPDHTNGALAESWSQPDPLTYIVNVRQGVRWHNKAPMNGRAFTAQDVSTIITVCWDSAADSPSERSRLGSYSQAQTSNRSRQPMNPR